MAADHYEAEDAWVGGPANDPSERGYWQALSRASFTGWRGERWLSGVKHAGWGLGSF